MTDFFGDLERHLHRAARRRARVRRAVPVAVAILLVAAVAVPAFNASDPERSVPADVASGDPCSGARLGEFFSVFQTEPESLPERHRQPLAEALPRQNLRFGQAQRAVRDVWLVPACDGEDVVICAAGPVHRCVDYDRALWGAGLYARGGRYLALVPDDLEAVMTVGDNRIRGATTGNVFAVEYDGPGAERAQISFGNRVADRLGESSPETETGCAPVDAPVPQRVIDVLGVFSRPGQDDPGTLDMHEVPYARGAHLVREHADGSRTWIVAVTPVTGGCDPAAPRRTSNDVCVVRRADDGVLIGGFCAPLTRVRQMEAIHGHPGRDGAGEHPVPPYVIGVVPDDVGGVELEYPDGGTVRLIAEDNFVFGEVDRDQVGLGRARVLALR